MKLYEEIGTEVFGNSRVVEIIGCSEVTATSYLKRMEDELKIIVPVEGMGKGKYKFSIKKNIITFFNGNVVIGVYMHDTINHLGYIPIRCMNTRRIEQVDDYERTTKSGLYKGCVNEV